MLSMWFATDVALLSNSGYCGAESSPIKGRTFNNNYNHNCEQVDACPPQSEILKTKNKK